MSESRTIRSDRCKGAERSTRWLGAERDGVRRLRIAIGPSHCLPRPDRLAARLKAQHREAPRIEQLADAYRDLRAACIQREIQSLSLQLGCLTELLRDLAPRLVVQLRLCF